MIYLDTSVLFPLCYLDEKTETIFRTLEASAIRPVVLSDWTITEFYSALGCNVRTRQISSKNADTALEKLALQIRAGLVTCQIDPADHIRAQSLMARWMQAPKAGDALHIAAAERLGATLFTQDKVMARHAARNALKILALKT